MNNPFEPPAPDKPKNQSSILSKALRMASGTLSSRVLGLLRDALIMHFFSRTVTDAFIVAFRLPNLFRRILGEGALNVSFLPVFIELIKKPGWSAEQQKNEAFRLAHAIFTILVLLTGVLSVFGVIFIDEIIELLVGSEAFREVPGKLKLTSHLAQIMFAYLFLVSCYAFFMSIANALGAFFWPAVAPALFNLCVIVSCFIPSLRFDGDQLAWGVLVGGVVQFACVAIQLAWLRSLPRFSFNWPRTSLVKVLTNTGPGLLGLGVSQLISFANVYFAAQLSEGAHTYLYNGDRLLELPQSLLAISLGTALLPALSQLYTQGQKSQMLATASRYSRLLLFLALPSALGLFLLAQPIVSIIFGRGEFQLNDVEATAEVVKVYAFLLIASSFVRVLSPSFYAVQDTKTPAYGALVSLLTHLLLAQLLIRSFGLTGLAASSTLAGFANLLFLVFFYQKRIGSLDWSALVISFTRWLPALLFMAVLLWFGAPFLKSLSGFSLALGVVLLIFLSGVSYFTIATLFGAEEMKLFFASLSRRFKPKN